MVRTLELPRAHATIVALVETMHGVDEDEEDELVLATAVAGLTSYLVTGDTVLRGDALQSIGRKGISIMTRSVAFYEALGLERSGEINPMWTEFSLEGSRFALHGPVDGDLPALGGRTDVILDVPADAALDRLVERCRSEGFPIGAEINDIGFGRFFWVKDPDGLPVTVIEQS